MGGRVDGAVAQAVNMLEILERTHPGVAEALRDDAIGELGRWSDVAVEFVSDVAADSSGQRCSVAGSYRHDFMPPRLQVAKSASVRRRHFTALHELGHHLQRTDTGLGLAVEEVDHWERFEDAACDEFASRILIPDELLLATVDPRGPTASSVVSLYEHSAASRAACCVRAAGNFNGLGAIVLYDASGIVNFSVPNGIYPPARGTDQSRTRLLRKALAEPERLAAFELETTLEFRNGTISDRLFAQAAWCDGYLIAVYAATTPAWRKFGMLSQARSGWRDDYAGADERECPGCNKVRNNAWFPLDSEYCRNCG